jgi:hypothetical protein
MNPPINITNYDKRRANSERGGNLGLADLSLEELKTILLERQEAMGLCQHPGGLLKISSTLPSSRRESRSLYEITSNNPQKIISTTAFHY